MCLAYNHQLTLQVRQLLEVEHPFVAYKVLRRRCDHLTSLYFPHTWRRGLNAASIPNEMRATFADDEIEYGFHVFLLRKDAEEYVQMLPCLPNCVRVLPVHCTRPSDLVAAGHDVGIHSALQTACFKFLFLPEAEYLKALQTPLDPVPASVT